MKNISLLGGIALAALGMTAPEFASAQKVAWKGAPQFSDADGSATFKVRGRVMFDAVVTEQDLDGTAKDSDSFNTRLRRFRLGVEGQYSPNLKYKAEVTFLGRDTPNVQAEDVFLEFANNGYSIVVGNQKTGVAMEEGTSSRYIAQMERSFLNGGFGFERVLGVGVVVGNGTNWGGSLFLNGDSVNESDVTGNPGSKTEMRGIQARGYFLPLAEKTKMLMIGGTVRVRETNEDSKIQYRARPETNLGDRLVDTGAKYTEDKTYTVDVSGVAGPFWASAEYARSDAEATGISDEFSSWNLQAGWYITGESRGFKAGEGVWDRTAVNAPTNEGGLGAWELRGRYDTIDLDSAITDGGVMKATTLGVNWMPVKYVRLMGEYVVAEVEDRAIGNNGDFNAIQFRAQFDF